MTFDPRVLKQLKKLPLTPGTAFLGGRRVLTVTVRGEEEVALTLWVDQEGGLRNLEVSPASLDEAEELARALVKAMLRPAQAPACRPEQVFVADPDTARALEAMLQPLGISVGTDPLAGEAIKTMLQELDEAAQSNLEGYFSQEGVTPDAVLDLFELAGEFFELAPWETISTGMLLVLEGLTPKPLYCSILGSEGQEYGFALYPDLKGPRRMAQGKPPQDSLFLTYSCLHECGPCVAREIEELGLPLCQDIENEVRAPLLLQARRQKSNPMPTAEELQLALQAMTALVDSLETGSSTVRVGTSQVTVAYEDLRELTAPRRKVRA